ncbi:hypothetical protein [Nocardiopsis salina]|uniref:hypothetical protein n=1 Tax=Nocardiopsis salina TaxID=245836 RepID=UPI000347B664|nr:hypothetical protein [Nocardiopsis salina]
MTYERRVPAHPALIGAMVLMALGGCGILYAAARDQPDETVALWMVVALAIVMPLLIATFHVRVRLAGATLTIALWPLWRRRVPVDRITSVETVPVSAFADFSGVGLRFNSSGDLGVLMRSGTGVRVTADDGRVCTVVVPDAEDLARRVDEARDGT